MKVNDLISNGQKTWKVTELKTDKYGNVENIKLDEMINRDILQEELDKVLIKPDYVYGTEAEIVHRAINDWDGNKITENYITKEEYYNKTKNAVVICDAVQDNINNIGIKLRDTTTTAEKVENEAHKYDNIILRLLNDRSWFENNLAFKMNSIGQRGSNHYSYPVYEPAAQIQSTHVFATWLKSKKYVAVLDVGKATATATYNSIFLKFYKAHDKYKGIINPTMTLFGSSVLCLNEIEENYGSFNYSYETARYPQQPNRKESITKSYSSTQGFIYKSTYYNNWDYNNKTNRFSYKKGLICRITKLLNATENTYIKHTVTVSLNSENGYGCVFISNHPTSKSSFFDDNHKFIYPEENKVINGAKILYARKNDTSNTQITLTIDVKYGLDYYVGLMFYKEEEDDADLLLQEGLCIWNYSMQYYDVDSNAPIDIPEENKFYIPLREPSQYYPVDDDIAKRSYVPIDGDVIKSFTIRTDTATTDMQANMTKVNDNLILIGSGGIAETTETAWTIVPYYFNSSNIPTAGSTWNSTAAGTTSTLYATTYFPSLYDNYVFTIIYDKQTMVKGEYNYEKSKSEYTMTTYVMNPLNGAISNINETDTNGNRPSIPLGVEYFDYTNSSGNTVDNTTGKAYTTYFTWYNDEEHYFNITGNEINVSYFYAASWPRDIKWPVFCLNSVDATFTKSTYSSYRMLGMNRALPVKVAIGYDAGNGNVIPKTIDEYDLKESKIYDINYEDDWIVANEDTDKYNKMFMRHNYWMPENLLNIVVVGDARYIIKLREGIALPSKKDYYYHHKKDYRWKYRDDWYKYYFEVVYMDPATRYFCKSDLTLLDLAKMKYLTKSKQDII